jgi:hypothetical protein
MAKKFWQEFPKKTAVNGDDKILLGNNADGKTMYADIQQVLDNITGGVTVHNLLTGRDAASSHPIAAITGLQAVLNTIVTTHNLLNNRNATDSHPITAITGLEYILKGFQEKIVERIYIDVWQENEPESAIIFEGMVWYDPIADQLKVYLSGWQNIACINSAIYILRESPGSNIELAYYIWTVEDGMIQIVNYKPLLQRIKSLEQAGGSNSQARIINSAEISEMSPYAPESPTAGQIWYRTGGARLLMEFKNSEWVAVEKNNGVVYKFAPEDGDGSESYYLYNDSLVLLFTVRNNGSGSGGGVTVHNLLTGRDAADSHPIASITGLQAVLNTIVTTHNLLNNRNAADSHPIAAITGLQAELNKIVTVHNLLTGRDSADSHAIAAITGLRAELDNLEYLINNISSGTPDLTTEWQTSHIHIMQGVEESKIHYRRNKVGMIEVKFEMTTEITQTGFTSGLPEWAYPTSEILVAVATRYTNASGVVSILPSDGGEITVSHTNQYYYGYCCYFPQVETASNA